MKLFPKLVLLITLTVVLSACGGTPAAPTMSAQDIQATAVAAAFTIVAQTQAAIPTNTPIPPTNTPEPSPTPTETPLPSPTLDPALVPTFTPLPPTAGGDPCNKALGSSVSGTQTKIRLSNETKGSLVISLYLNLTPFGECGYRGYNLEKGGSVIITDLVTGCYNISVFVTLPNKNSKAFGYGCINNTDLWEFKIYEDKAVLLSP
ncbi:MAG: hypothetical protein ACOYYF_00755 [Chloroflexota bacterium]|nr:hypothetical protein [Chloroflexota bacterium]MBI5703473.1 hypothetical protein [Chloroflexota bacterium]